MSTVESSLVRRMLVVLVSGALALATTRDAGAVCAGDCDNDGRVAVNELVLAVNITLGKANISTCRNADYNNDNHITIDELIRAVDNSLHDCQATPVVFNTNPNDPQFMKVSAPTGETAEFNGAKDGNGVPTAASSIVMTDGDGDTQVDFDTAGGVAQATVPGGVSFRFEADASTSDAVLVTATSDGAHDVSFRLSMAGATGAGIAASSGMGEPTGGVAGAPSTSFAEVDLKVCGKTNKYAEVDFIVQPPGVSSQVQTYRARRVPNSASYVAPIPLTTGSADLVADVCYGAETVANKFCSFIQHGGGDAVEFLCRTPDQYCTAIRKVVTIGQKICKVGVPSETEVELTCQYLRDVAQRIAPSTYVITPVVRVPYQQSKQLPSKTVRATDPSPVWDYDLQGQTALMSFFYRQTCTSLAAHTYVPGKCAIGYFECVPGGGFGLQYDVLRVSDEFPDGDHVQSSQILITRYGTQPGPFYGWEHTDLSWAGAFWDDMLFSWPFGQKLFRHYW